MRAHEPCIVGVDHAPFGSPQNENLKWRSITRKNSTIGWKVSGSTDLPQAMGPFSKPRLTQALQRWARAGKTFVSQARLTVALS
jgi:hypothetical protein